MLFFLSLSICDYGGHYFLFFVVLEPYEICIHKPLSEQNDAP